MPMFAFTSQGLVVMLAQPQTMIAFFVAYVLIRCYLCDLQIDRVHTSGIKINNVLVRITYLNNPSFLSVKRVIFAA